MQTLLGGNGTIGSVLAKELTRYTDKIRIVGRNPKKINESDELFKADLSDPEQVDRAIAGSEVVYLLVGFEYDIKVWRNQWPLLMRATLDACKKHGAKLVFFDNVYLYDIQAIPHMIESSPINPSSLKGAVRRDIAQMLMDEVKNGSLTALIARSADFYGPANEKSFLIETVYKNLKKGKKANWFVDAGKKHSFTYTPDAARATALLGNTPDAYNQVWHLPTDPESLNGKEWTELFAQELKTKSGLMVLPTWMIKIIGLFVPFMKEMPEMMYQYDRTYFFDSSKFMKRFPFEITSYKKGVQEIVTSEK
jgi:nucleoside-diphosphate-sugar epimerase